ncbi:LysR family transcriptional regulator [Falsiroseomonas stagni]|uniref:LysR family transcriptional regulator, regulator for bpeEF and oprC n=1 Tax=Falsiroseomonas stagni DSM 19981 TaxID=1123062 RepID=A0A1I4EA01_9PROT|nr:LysR family transcriptional regulator [Falsiroseomonas stagni]SFL01021.1 LysR family transcriptional regulator, regulator for bpeEF and oprC [Falsiroseomonas stagni DSM 19981]
MDRLRAMEVFVAVAEAGSLAGAATRLGLSAPTVTAQVQALEAHLRCALLHRSTRSLRLTPEGEAFLSRARAILGAMEEAEAGAGGDAARGVLRVQVPIAVGHMVLAPALAAFAAAHPGLRVVTILGNDVDSLARRGIDVAIRMDEVETGDLVARPVYRSTHVVCAAPGFLARHGVPTHPRAIDPAQGLAWVADTAAAPRAWRFQRGAERVVVNPTGPLAFNSSDALLNAAAQGAGFCYVLGLLAHAHLRDGRLRAVLEEWETEAQVFYVAYPKARFTAPKIRAFADYAARVFPDHLRQAPASPIRIRRR